MEEKSAESSSPAISLPRGGGAIQGMGETFQPNLFSGTGNFNIPIFTSPGRDGFHPQLSLQYSTGNGNGIFGLGWNLSIPRITRKTEKGLPRYADDDVFVLSGAEDLVPKLKDSSPGEIDSEFVFDNDGQNTVKYRITRYLPRTEGLFARIESWEELDENNNNTLINHFWRVTTKENVTSIYGRSESARIAAPDSKLKIFEWLLDETFDSRGNHIRYEYSCDDPQLNISEIFEQNRKYCQVYPRRIFYGNVPDQLTDYNGNQFSAGVVKHGTDHRNPFKSMDRHYVFEVVFDYGDWRHPLNDSNKFTYLQSASSQENLNSSTPVRTDSFSSFRPGFELRTLRRCSNLLMVHHFPELGGTTLVKSTDFIYEESDGSKLSLLTSATVTGYSKTGNDSYHHERMPPVEFKYSKFQPGLQKYQSITAKNNNLPAVSLKDANTALVDLTGNGLQDIVQTNTGGFQYWRNRGNTELEDPHILHESPSGLALADPGVSFGDMGGDGLTDLIVNKGAVKGFFELQPEKEIDGQLQIGWLPQSFRHYDDQPSINLADQNLRMLDLTGDGLTDLLITTDNDFIWYQSKGEQGYSEQRHTPKINGLEDIFFNDPSGRVRLADISGDGLKDIVLLHNGRVDYWPNRGYGSFGPQQTMSGDTLLPPGFNPERLFLADLDGSGTADLVYVDFNEVHFWFNQSGNAWSTRQTISGTPMTLDTTSLSFTDFYSTGTTSLLWSYNFGTVMDGNYKVLDFCGGNKPYLLNEMDNNLGATTRVRYAPSTKFYLDDAANGNYWATPLPFPVQVVEKTESIDHISKTKLVTRYRYHHGFYDGREREFRGFGRVDQIDTESFDTFELNDLHEADFDNNTQAHHVPPVETRTWYHTGAYFEHTDILDRYQSEYLAGIEALDSSQRPRDNQAFDLNAQRPDLTQIDNDTITEAFRALNGSVIRTEVYAHDNSSSKNFPYSVNENTYQVKVLQSKRTNPHAVYLNTATDQISYHYERNHNGSNLVDPRIQHQITLEVDDFGNPLRSANIAYKRRQTVYPEQDQDLIFVTANRYCEQLATLIDFRHSATVETVQYEITGLSRVLNNGFGRSDIDTALTNAQNIGFEINPTPGQLQKRKLSHHYVLFWNNNLSGSETIGNTGFHGLVYETYQLALTPQLRTSVYDSIQISPEMGQEGGYRSKLADNWIDADQGDWWVPSGKQTFDATKFYQAVESIDPFVRKTSIQYDPYCIFSVRVRDFLDNVQEGLIDYRTLQPFLIRDINGNITEAAFSTLGLLAGTAMMGKAGWNPTVSILGISDQAVVQMRINTDADSLEAFQANLSKSDIDLLYMDPDGPGNTPYSAVRARSALQKATNRIIYRFHAYITHDTPVSLCSITREIHHKDSTNSPLLLSYSCSDGFGREIQKKIQAEPDGSGTRRWTGSGWNIFNNKGKPVQQFEPFFSHTHQYESYSELAQQNKLGVSSTLFYDPNQRVVCTIHPDQSYDKVIFNPWKQESWDRNDTVLLHPQTDVDVKEYTAQFLVGIVNYQTWLNQRIPDLTNIPAQPNLQQQAVLKTIEHANTPTTNHLNVQGTVFLTVSDNKTENIETKLEVDIQGNNLSITDARNLKTFSHGFDMVGRKLRIDSGDAGNKHLFLSADNLPTCQWDANGNRINSKFDELRRPQSIFVEYANGTTHLVEHFIYGESRAQSEINNNCGAIWKHYDGAGLAVTESSDFKGNVITAQRKLLADDTLKEVNWPLDGNGVFDEAASANLLQSSTRINTAQYQTSTQYDAMNRITISEHPDGTLQTLAYNHAGSLENITVQNPNQNPENYVKNIDYNARGQRVSIEYGNGVITKQEYEPETFRLTAIISDRPNPVPTKIQELSFVYDPVGNITSVRDDAQSKIFNNNQAIDPESKYKYDAVYRLIEATGREHESMTACHYQANGKKHTEFLPLPQSAANAQALINYLVKYEYDQSGNLQKIEHINSLRTTTRNQAFDSQNNRIDKSDSSCSNEDISIPHDPNGNITRLPHLPDLSWDYKNQLVEVQLNQGSNPDKASYQYDSTGQRVRKTVVRNNGNDKSERIYLGNYEIYTKTVAGTVQKQRETIHVSDGQKRIAVADQEKGPTNLPRILNKTVRYQLGNHLGSAVLELDQAAKTISYEEYYPYGGTAYMAGRSQVETSLKRYRYSGKERDDETGMYYYGARYYAPWLGRWISCDPAGKIDSINLFIAFKDNPVSFVDQFGLKSKPPAGGVEQATSVGEGLLRMKELGLQEGKEYGLVRVPKTNELWVMEGTRGQVRFGNNTPLGHTHTGYDLTAHPSNADFDELVAKGVSKHYIYGKETGWAAVTQDLKKGIFKVEIEGGQTQYFTKNVDPIAAVSSDAEFARRWSPHTSYQAAVRASYMLKGIPHTSAAMISRDFGRSALPLLERLRVADKLKAAGAGAGVVAGLLGSAAGGYRFGDGLVDIADGRTAEGLNKSTWSGLGLGVGLGGAKAVEAGAMLAGGGGFALFAAGIAMGGSLYLAEESINASLEGRPTPIDEAGDWYVNRALEYFGYE